MSQEVVEAARKLMEKVSEAKVDERGVLKLYPATFSELHNALKKAK